MTTNDKKILQLQFQKNRVIMLTKKGPNITCYNYLDYLCYEIKHEMVKISIIWPLNHDIAGAIWHWPCSSLY